MISSLWPPGGRDLKLRPPVVCSSSDQHLTAHCHVMCSPIEWSDYRHCLKHCSHSIFLTWMGLWVKCRPSGTRLSRALTKRRVFTDKKCLEQSTMLNMVLLPQWVQLVWVIQSSRLWCQTLCHFLNACALFTTTANDLWWLVSHGVSLRDVEHWSWFIHPQFTKCIMFIF